MALLIGEASTSSFIVSVTMLGMGVAALVARFAIPSVTLSTITIFERVTDGLFILYYLATLKLWLIAWILLLYTGTEVIRIRHSDRNFLVVLSFCCLSQGTLGVLDRLGIVYMRAAVLIPAAFVMLIALAWSSFVASKKELSNPR